MRSSLLTRAGSLAAAAVIATTGAMATAGAAGATTHPRRLPTHLSIATRRAVEHRRHVTVIGGRLTSFTFPLRDKLVFLDRVTPTHKLIIVGREWTNRHGAVLFVVAPEVIAHYALVFPGTPNFHSSHSRVVTVRP